MWAPELTRLPGPVAAVMRRRGGVGVGAVGREAAQAVRAAVAAPPHAVTVAAAGGGSKAVVAAGSSKVAPGSSSSGSSSSGGVGVVWSRLPWGAHRIKRSGLATWAVVEAKRK